MELTGLQTSFPTQARITIKINRKMATIIELMRYLGA